jgi:hypothetical protein
MPILCPSTYPNSRSPCRKASIQAASEASEPPVRKPIRGMDFVCWAAASGIPRTPRVSRIMSPTVLCHMLISSRWLPASDALEPVGDQTVVFRLQVAEQRFKRTFFLDKCL